MRRTLKNHLGPQIYYTGCCPRYGIFQYCHAGSVSIRVCDVNVDTSEAFPDAVHDRSYNDNSQYAIASDGETES